MSIYDNMMVVKENMEKIVIKAAVVAVGVGLIGMTPKVMTSICIK